MTATDDLIRAAIHELVAAAPAPRELGLLEPTSVHSLTDSLTERMVPVSMNARTSTRRPTPAALGAVAVAIGIVGGIWYLTSDRTTPEPVVEQPTDTVAGTALPSTAVPTTEHATTAAPSTTWFSPPAVQRTILSPIPEGYVELTDTEVLLRGDDRVVAVDTATEASRVVTPVTDPARLVGVTRGSLVVEVCCDGELVLATGTAAAVRTSEFDPETGETTETPTAGWRFAAIQPSGGRLAAVVGTDLVIASTTDGGSTVRSLLELGREDHEPVFGTVTDLGWTGNGADLVLVEELGDTMVVHRVGGSTGAHIDRAVVAPVGAIEGVSFAGPGPGRSFAVHVDAADGADDEVRIMDGTTLALLERITLPADTDQVRIAPDGSLVWTDGTGITIRHPDGSIAVVPVP